MKIDQYFIVRKKLHKKQISFRKRIGMLCMIVNITKLKKNKTKEKDDY